MKNTIIKTYCLRICCQGTPKRAVHAEGEAVSINTKVKICGHRNHRLEKSPTPRVQCAVVEAFSQGHCCAAQAFKPLKKKTSFPVQCSFV